MNWRNWKIGLAVAVLTGACTALTVGGIVPTMTIREGILVCLGSIAKDILLFLKEHPADRATDGQKPNEPDKPMD